MSHSENRSAPRSLALKILTSVGLPVAVSLATLVFVEGLCSTYYFASRLRYGFKPVITERLYTQYDPLLGWANVPGGRFPGFFGPGIDVTINSQGIRALQEYGPKA